MTLLALDVQTLRKSYKAGLKVDLLQIKAINSTNAICSINTIFLPRGRKHILSQDPLCATVIDFMLLLASPLPICLSS